MHILAGVGDFKNLVTFGAFYLHVDVPFMI
jgi:hypothetical protein